MLLANSSLPLQFLNFILFLFVSSRFRYRELPHATVGVEALALTPDLKTGVGLTIAMSASEWELAGARDGCKCASFECGHAAGMQPCVE